MKISILGLGLMGSAMAERLLDSGYELTVYNRTRRKAGPLGKKGALVAETAARAVAASPGSILMVADADAVRNLLVPEGSDRPVLAGRTIIQMSTISPDQSRSLKTEVEASGGEYLEAPVLGSTEEARQGGLFVMAGSTPKQYERWLPLFRCFAGGPVHCGPVGTGAAFKLALNQLIAAEITAFAFSLGLVLRDGIDVEQFMRLLRKSSLYAPQFDKKLSRYLDRDFDKPHFPTKHLVKDIGLIAAEGRRLGLETSVVESLEAVARKARDSGWAEADYSAVYNVVNPSGRTPGGKA
jgi:3-hydroxyisobutyrate dehydrogenase